jgi:chain length determinant protein EpsF
MSLQLFLSTLRARFGLLALVLATTVLAAIVVSVLLPKSYKATVSLVVDAKEEQSLRSALQPLLEPRERMSYMQTQLDILTSEKVARKVVRALKLAANPRSLADFEEQGGGSIEDWLAEALLKSLKVETSQSNVIQMTYSSRDPRHSAEVANAFAKAYIDTVLELRVEPTRQAASWFDEQLKTLRVNLETAQAKLTTYHRQKGIISADERLDVENARLGELSAQLVKVQDQTLDLTARAQQARDFLGRGGAPDQLSDVLASPLIQTLKTELAQGEAKLQEMATQYGPAYPQYQRQLSENRSLREKLDSEMRKIVAGFEHAARQSGRREAELRRELTAQRARLLGLKEDRNELTVLARDVESAQRAYDTALQRYVVSQVESRASQANVNVLTPAAVPRKPASPRPALNIALAIVVGTLLGVGVVILSELLDRRVRSREDLVNEWDVPVLGVLNARRSPRWLRASPDSALRALPSPD